SLRVVVVSRTTNTSPMSDTKSSSAVRAHGRMRLLNGFEARLRLLFTGRKTSLRAYWGRPKLLEEYTALGNNRKRRKFDTPRAVIGCTKIAATTYWAYYPLACRSSRLTPIIIAPWKCRHRKNRLWEPAVIPSRLEQSNASQWRVCLLSGAIFRSPLTARSRPTKSL